MRRANGVRLLVLATGALVAAPAAAGPAIPSATCFGQNATIVGTAGGDTLTGTPGADVVAAGEGADIVFTGEGDDVVCGDAGNDLLFGQNGNDRIDGGADNDGMLGQMGDDTLVGGDGLDLVAYLDSPGPIAASLLAGTVTGGAGNDTLSGFESVTGSRFDDTITGDEDGNVLSGLGGNDTIDGRGGLDGVIFGFSEVPVNVNLGAGAATGEGTDRLVAMEGISGSNFDDVLTGSDDLNFVDGASGSDTIRGLGQTDLLLGDTSTAEAPGNDRLDGGAGDDFLQPSLGSDVLDGGDGRLDFLDVSQLTAGVTANLGAGTVTGVGAPRTLRIEALNGSPFSDTLVGDNGPNIIFGNEGNDRLAGAGGDDFLNGGAGTDAFNGGAGTDYCLDGRGPGCELSGVPGGAAPSVRSLGGNLARSVEQGQRVVDAVRARRPLTPAVAVVDEIDPAELGNAFCSGSVAPQVRAVATAARKREATAQAPKKVHPPPSYRPPKAQSPFLPDWLQGGFAESPRVTWRGTLFRYDAKRRAWRAFRQTPVLQGQLDPSGAALWTDARGRAVNRFALTVPAGGYAWKAELRFDDGTRRFDWVEPHTDYSRRTGGIYSPSCTFR